VCLLGNVEWAIVRAALWSGAVRPASAPGVVLALLAAVGRGQHSGLLCQRVDVEDQEVSVDVFLNTHISQNST
jgi:hypothetical protein